MPAQNKRRQHFFSLALSLFIFLIAQFFFITLIMSSYQDYRQQTFTALVEVNAAYTANKLSVVATLGRSINNYRHARQDLQQLSELSQSQDVFFTDATGQVLLKQSPDATTHLDPQLLASGSATLGGLEYIFEPYYSINGKVAGYVAAATPLSERQLQQFSLIQGNDYQLLLAASALSVLLFLLSFKLRLPSFLKARAPATATDQGHHGILRFMLPFVIGQLFICAASGLALTQLVEAYSANLEQALSATISSSFAEIKNQHIALADVGGYEQYFARLKQDLLAIDGISLYDQQGQLIAGDKQEEGSGSSTPLIGTNGLLGTLQVTVYASVLSSLLLDMGLKLITLLIISTVLAYELSSLLNFEMRRLNDYPQGKAPFETGLIRPLAFLFVLALYMPITIVPVYMGTFRADFPGWDHTMLRSLAVICEMGFIAISSFYILLTRPYPQRWKRLGVTSLTLLSVAAFTAALAPNGYLFLLSRALYGLGYGAMLASCQLYVISNVPADKRGAGMSALTAGLYSGVLCAAATGGIIADNLGIRAVFISSALLFAFNVCLYLYLCSRRKQQLLPENTAPAADKSQGLTLHSILKLLRDPQTVSLLICQALPYSIIGIGFFNFLLPVAAADHGMGATTVGQLNFIYAFLIILTSPLLGKLLDLARRYGFLLLSLSLIASASVPLLFMLPNFVAAACGAMICLGISAAINESGLPAVLSRFAMPQQAGAATSVMLLDAIQRIGQTLGPLLVALLLSLGGNRGFIGLSAAVLLLSLLFCLIQLKYVNKDSGAAISAAKGA